jgi:hypothetical protein
MGPKPRPEYTLDRIDFSHPEYAPTKVRCTDKATQSENRSVCIHLTHNATGQTFTVPRLAELTGRDINELRKAIHKSKDSGLPEDQIIDEVLGRVDVSLNDLTTGEGAASSSTLRLRALEEACENAGRAYKNCLAEFVDSAEFGVVADAVRMTAPNSVAHQYLLSEERYDQHYRRMSAVQMRMARPLNSWRDEYKGVYRHNREKKIGYDDIAISDRMCLRIWLPFVN